MPLSDALRAGCARAAHCGPARAAVALLLAAVIAAAYLPALNASFQFDDWNVIVRDPRVQSLSAWWHSMPGIRPLTRLSFALNHALGADAGGMRALNIGCHYAAALLVFVLVESVARGVAWSPPAARWSALWVALVFATHPVQTEAVTYLAGRSVSLSAAFALASLVSWQRAGTGTRGARHGLWLSAAFYLLAVCARETALVLPLALALLVASRRPAAETAGYASDQSPAIWPHWLLLAGLAATLVLLPDYRRLLGTSLQIRPMTDNLLTQAAAVQYLLAQLAWPAWLNADPWLPAVTAVTHWVIARALLMAGTVAIGVVLLRRRPDWSFGILWCALWLAPTNSLLARYDVANDRQLYLALVGPSWLLCCAFRGLLTRARAPARIAVAIVASLVVTTLLATTIVRNRVYADEITFWSDVVSRSPDNPRAANNLGYAFAQACRDREAESQFSASLRLDPGYATAGVNLRLLRAGILPRAAKCP